MFSMLPWSTSILVCVRGDADGGGDDVADDDIDATGRTSLGGSLPMSLMVPLARMRAEMNHEVNLVRK